MKTLSHLLAALTLTLLVAASAAQDPYPFRAAFYPPPELGTAGFGKSVAMDGDYLAVGAPGGSGNVVVYRVSTRAIVATLREPGNAEFSFFGSALAVSGSRVVVGAPGTQEWGPGGASAYVYDVEGATPEAPVLTLRDPRPDGRYSRFGNAVAISGRRVVIGAFTERTDAGRIGSVYVYSLGSAAPATPVVVLNNPDSEARDCFGTSVAIWETTVVVGAAKKWNDPRATRGAVSVYELAGPNPTVPTRFYRDAVASYYHGGYGHSVAVSGHHVAVAGPRPEGVAIYDLRSPSPEPAALLALPGDWRGFMSSRVALSGSRLVAAGAGSAYVYELESAPLGVLVETLHHPRPERLPILSSVIAISGDRIVAAALQSRTASDRAAVYLFEPAGPPVFPEMGVEEAGTALTDGSSAVDLGGPTVSESSSRMLTITNSGDGSLSGVRFSVDGTDAASFGVTAAPSDRVPAHGRMNITVTFAPSSLGEKTAVLHIASNDADESPFDITLAGRGANQPPVLREDFVWSPTGSPVEIDVLANDRDPEGGSLTLMEYPAAYGDRVEVVTTPDGQRIRYTPITTDTRSWPFRYPYYVTDSAGAKRWQYFTVHFGEPRPIVTGGVGYGSPIREQTDAQTGTWTQRKLQHLGVPSLNGFGQLSFKSFYSSDSGPQQAIFGPKIPVVRESLAQLVSTGAPVPDEHGALLSGVVFRSFRTPLLNDRGHVAFLATIDNGSQAPTYRATGIWTNGASGALRLVAREGGVAAGVNLPGQVPSGAIFAKFKSVALSDSYVRSDEEPESPPGEAVAFVAQLAIGPAGVTEDDDLGLWIYESAFFANASLRLVLREGQMLAVGATPTRQVRTFTALTPQAGAPGHSRGLIPFGVLAQLKFTDDTEALVRVAGDGAIELLSETGGSVGGTDLTFRSFAMPTQNGRGAAAFVATLETPAETTAVIAVAESGESRVIAKTGDAAPGAGGASFAKLETVVIQDQERVAFLGTLAGVSPTKDSGIWMAEAPNGEPGSILKLVAREGEQAPGVPTGGRWASFESLAFPGGTAGPAFVAKLRVPPEGQPNPAGIDATNQRGLWAMDSAGVLQLVAREGTFRRGAGIIRKLTVLSHVSGSPAQLRSFADRELVILVTTDRGGESIMKILLP